MKERPILFNGEMVRAILAGTKTQTRRIVKPAPIPEISEIEEMPATEPQLGHVIAGHSGIWEDMHSCDQRWKCPFGVPGDRLWVREAWNVAGLCYGKRPLLTQAANKDAWRYAADDATGWQHGWLPSIHMPRWASRTSLEVTSVRIERLRDITESDARAEGVGEVRSPDLITVVDSSGGTCQITPDYVHGVPKVGDDWMGRRVTHVEAAPGRVLSTARESYRALWDSIYAEPSAVRGDDGEISHYVSYPWDGEERVAQHHGKPWHIHPNPWVWVVEFKRI